MMLALRLTFLYVVMAGLWILLSDHLLLALVNDPAWITAIQTWKGWGFVAFSAVLIYVLLHKVSRQREEFNREIEAHARQQEAISVLRKQALNGADLASLFDEAAMLVAITLDVEYSSVLELDVSTETLVLRAGVGWQHSDAESQTVTARLDTLAGYTLRRTEPVVFSDLPGESRFTNTSPLTAWNIVSGMTMAITGHSQPFGVLGAYSDRPRSFTEDERRFLLAIANVLATAVARDRTERELRLQKTLLECQSETSPDGILVVAPDGKIRSFNQRFLTMWGIPSHVMATGSHVAALEVVRNQLPDPQQFENRIMELYAYSDQTSQEEIVLKDGRVFDRYSAPVKDSDGTHYGRVWYYRDITAFKQAQDALRASEQKFRTLVESMDDIIFTLDREQRHTGVFGRWLERYGLSADFFLGKTSRETSIDDTVAAAHEAANERALTGEYVVYEWSVGEPPFYVQTSLSPVHNEQGDVMGLVGVGRDITRLKRMEEALRESNRRIGNILESITDAFFALDHDYRFVYMNQRAADLLQHNRDDLLGKVLWNEFPDAVNLAFYQQYHLAMIGQVTVNFEEFYPALNTWYEMHVYPSDDGLAVYFQDITERKRVEEELKRHNRELAALNLVTEAVNLFLDLPDVLVTLQVLLAEHLHIAAGAIFLYHEHEEEAYLSLEMAWGLPVHMKETFTHLAVAGAHNEPVVRDQVPILLNNMHLESPALYATLHTSQSAWHSYLGVPILAQGEIQGVMDLFSETSAHFTDDQVAFFATLGQQVGTAIQNARLFDEVCMGRERLQTLSYRLLEVQEEERRTVAMELHDEIGQILTGLNLSLELAARVPPEQLSERLAYASELVNDLMLRVREMSLELRPPMLDDLGLLAALLWQFEQYTAQTTIQVIFKHRNMEQRFAPEIEVAFYRMIQEALTNVARHADVSEVVVRLWSSNGVIGLHIEDQGKGFNPDTAFSNHTSSGLSGLRERVLLLNGKLSIDSEPGQGSCLAVEIPLRRELYDHNSSC